MTTKKNTRVRSSKLESKTKGIIKKKILDYETEYEAIKPFIDVEDFEKSMEYIKNLTKRVKRTNVDRKTNNKSIEALCFIIYSKFSKITSALDSLKILEGYLDEFDSQSLISIDITIAKADIFWKIGKQEEALSLLNTLETEFAKKQLSNNILERIGDLFNIKGIIYWMTGDVLASQDSFQHSLSIMGRIGNKTKFTKSLNNLGNVYTYKGDINAGLDLHLQALEIRMQLGIKNQIASSLGNIAEIYHY